MKSNSQPADKNLMDSLITRKTLHTVLASHDGHTKFLGFRTKPIPQDIIALQTFAKESKVEQLNAGEWYQLANLLEKLLKEPDFNSLTNNNVILAIQRLKKHGIFKGINPLVENQIKMLVANPHVAKAILLLEDTMLTPAMIEGIQTGINEEDAEAIVLRMTMINVRLKALTTEKVSKPDVYFYDLKNDAKSSTSLLPPHYNCPDLLNLLHKNIKNANVIFMFFSKITEMGVILTREELTTICNSLNLQHVERILKCIVDLNTIQQASSPWGDLKFEMNIEIIKLFIQEGDNCEKAFDFIKTLDTRILRNPALIAWIRKALQQNNLDTVLDIIKEFKFDLNINSIPILCNTLVLINAKKLKPMLITMRQYITRVNEQYNYDDNCLLGFCKYIATLNDEHIENYFQLIQFIKPILDVKYYWRDFFQAAPYLNQIKQFLTQNQLNWYGVAEAVIKNAKQLSNITLILAILKRFTAIKSQLTDSWRGREIVLQILQHPHPETVKAILEKIDADPKPGGYSEYGTRFNNEKLDLILSLANNQLNATQIDNIAYCINLFSQINPRLLTLVNIATITNQALFMKIKPILDRLLYTHYDGNKFVLVYLTAQMLNTIIKYPDMIAAATQEIQDKVVYPFIFKYPRLINHDFFEVMRSLKGSHLLNDSEVLEDIFSTPFVAETLQKLNKNRHTLRTHYLSAPLPWHDDTEFRIAVLRGNRSEYKEATRKIKEDQAWRAELIKVFRRKTATNPMRDAAFNIVNSRLQGSIRDYLFGDGIKIKADSKQLVTAPAVTLFSHPKPVKPLTMMTAAPIVLDDEVSQVDGTSAAAASTIKDAKSDTTTPATNIFDLISYFYEEINKFKIVLGLSGKDSKTVTDNKLEKEINDILNEHDIEITKVSKTAQSTAVYDRHTAEMLLAGLQKIHTKIDSSLRAQAAENRIQKDNPITQARFNRYKAYAAIFNNRIKPQLEVLQTKLNKNGLKFS